MSNPIRYDSLLVHYLARELDDRLRARRLKGVWMDPAARRLVLDLDSFALVWELHPGRGWIRELAAAAAGPGGGPGDDPGDEVGGGATGGGATGGGSQTAPADPAWGGRKIPTQRKPRVREVSAPRDERVLTIAIDAGGAGRASRFVVELMTNQWNVLALAPDATIVAALWPRDAGERRLRAGAVYSPPARRPRAGEESPLTEGELRRLLEDVTPAGRASALVRGVAWTSPLNAAALLGPAAEDPDPALLGAAWHRYAAVASRPEPSPQLLDVDGPAPYPAPYPVPLPGTRSAPKPTLLAALAAAASTDAAAWVAPEVLAALVARLEKVEQRALRLRADAEAAPADAARLRGQADLLMAQLHRVRRSDASVELDDFEGGTVTVPLDPARSAAENAEIMYDRARRRERAAAQLPVRVREALAEQNRLQSLLESLDRGAADPAEVAGWAAELLAEEGGTGGEERRALPYLRFTSSGGLEIRVGRSGGANDELTFHHSSPDDISAPRPRQRRRPRHPPLDRTRPEPAQARPGGSGSARSAQQPRPRLRHRPRGLDAAEIRAEAPQGAPRRSRAGARFHRLRAPGPRAAEAVGAGVGLGGSRPRAANLARARGGGPRDGGGPGSRAVRGARTPEGGREARGASSPPGGTHEAAAGPGGSAARSDATNSLAPSTPRSRITSMSALPTTTPSAIPATEAACPGVAIPKPTTTGTGAAARIGASSAASSRLSSVPPPVTPVREM